MSFIFGLLFLFLIIASYRILILKPARAQVLTEISCDERHAVQTDDGILLALYRYCPRNRTRTYPLFMLHGMAVNRFHYDNGTDLSLPRFFQDAGYDVWLLELRGCGNSTAFPVVLPDDRFDFDHYITQDIPKAIAYIKERTGTRKIHWFGHSMGGMILESYCSVFGDGSLSSVTLLGSPLDFSQWLVGKGRFVWKLLYRFCQVLPSFPLRYLARSLFPLLPTFLTLRLGPQSLSKIVNLSNLDRIHQWHFFYNGLSNLPRGLLLQTVNWVASGVMSSRDGRRVYSTGMQRLTVPFLCVASRGDISIPESAIRSGFDAARAQDKTWLTLEPTEKEKSLFGHADMIFSPACYTEFYPFLRNWLNERDDVPNIN